VTTGTFPAPASAVTARPAHAVPGRRATVVSAKPQLLFYGGYYCDLGLLAGALSKAGYTGKIISGTAAIAPR